MFGFPPPPWSLSKGATVNIYQGYGLKWTQNGVNDINKLDRGEILKLKNCNFIQERHFGF